MNDYLDKMIALAKKEPKTIEQMALKLSEEIGEVSQAVLSFNNSSGSKYKELTKEDAKEECVDVLLVATALFFKLSEEQNAAQDLQDIIKEKQEKWLKHMG